jgi:hypothetical protein
MDSCRCRLTPTTRPTLAALQSDFPAFQITREATLSGPRYVARSLHLSQNPHTLVTASPAELRAALATVPTRQNPDTHSPAASPPPLPRHRRPA